MTEKEFIKHCKSDIEYADGLELFLDEGGIPTDKNIRDLIAMVRWNANNLIYILEEII